MLNGAKLIFKASDHAELVDLIDGNVEETGKLLRAPTATDRAWDHCAARAGIQDL